ncbi:hypothetical protein [Acinetobacter portensis]|uniref:hypothetical protein n=1 Tax=Acinetobacter portensis TaxID=1839785 RepID=UPI0013D57DDC|nr:hypothetical protein [Acinetobacter portensis]
MDIKNKILNCFAIAFISLLFLFAFTWIIFDFQNSANALKDTWSIVSSLFGGISTLVAAYTAVLLFTDWRDNHNANIRKTLIEEALNSCNLHESNIFNSIEKIASFKEKLQLEIKFQKSFTKKNLFNPTKRLDDILLPIQDSHSSFLWGKNIIWKHLLCLEDKVPNEINISEVIERLQTDSRNISNIYLEIIKNTNIQIKIKKTDELNSMLANYLSFINCDIYLPLSSHRFEK